MHYHVVVAGVADNRYPLHEISLTEPDTIVESGRIRRVLSPYDQSALELALKQRDVDASVQISVYCVCKTAEDSLLRDVAAYKPDYVYPLVMENDAPWDALGTARALAEFIRPNIPPEEPILVGRELGDQDSGVIPGMLARVLDRAYIPNTLLLKAVDHALELIQNAGSCEMRVATRQPIVMGVSNDKRNKLRHPLMKNVMMAKRQSFSANTLAGVRSASVSCTALNAALPLVRSAEVQILQGDLTDQVDQLAQLLLAQKV